MLFNGLVGMKVRTIPVVMMVAIACIGFVVGTYPQVGHVTYEVCSDVEAALYGFTQTKANVGDLEMSLYESGGDGEQDVVVMIHGYSADKDVWPRFARHLSGDYHILIPDLAGHGDTGFETDWDYSIPAQAKRIRDLLDELCIDKVHLIGNSMGGFISAYFALTYPERTLSAALVDPSGVVSPKLSEMELMLSKGRNPFEIHNQEEFTEFYDMTMARPPWLPGFILDAMAQKYQERRPELMQIFEDIRDNQLLDDRLMEIRAPVWLLWGREDRLIDESSARVWDLGVKDIQTHILDEIGHMPMVEAPERTASLYRGFLGRVTD